MCSRPTLQSGHRGVGVAAPGVGLEEDRLAEAHARPSLCRGVAADELVCRAAGGQRFRHRADVRLRPVVHATRRRQQVLAGVLFQLAPQRQRLLSEGDVEGVGVGEPEDPRAAVRAAELVAGLEPFEKHHRPAFPRQPPSGRRPHCPAADHNDVTVHQRHSSSMASLYPVESGFECRTVSTKFRWRWDSTMPNDV